MTKWVIFINVVIILCETIRLIGMIFPNLNIPR